MAVAVLALVAAACSPPPGGIPVQGGTFDVDVTVPSQSFSYDFLLCTATASTNPVQLTGATITVPSVVVAPGTSTITVPSVEVVIPSGTAAAGSLNISCFGTSLGTVDIALTIAGTATTGAAVLNMVTGELSLVDATIQLDGATVEIPGVGSIPLPPFDVSLGDIQINI